eukprot:5351034-Pyramimonas_sp.AAC.1
MRYSDAKLLDFNVKFSMDQGVKNRGLPELPSNRFAVMHKINKLHRDNRAQPPFPGLPEIPEIE